MKLTRAKFPIGKLAATPGVLAVCSALTLEVLLLRHVRGDWGEVDREDQQANDRALLDGTRLLSAYTIPSGVKVWIITEADRSITTVLLPEEY